MRRTVAALGCALVVSAATAVPAEGRADHAPKARTDRFTIPEDTRLTYTAPGVLSNDTDPEGRPLKVKLLRGAKHGHATLSARGKLRYRPDRNWAGTDSLVYVARDPAGNRDRARVVLTVSPVPEGGSSTITLTAQDPEGSVLD